MTEIEIKTQQSVNVYISEWDEGGVWIRLGLQNGSVYTSMNRDQANQMLECLQSILVKEATA